MSTEKKIHLSQLATEQENPASSELSSLPLSEALQLMHREDMRAVACVESQLPIIERIIEHTSKALQQGGRIIYVGAGTSGRLGVLDAVECPPTFSIEYDRVIGLIAGGEKAFVKAVEGAEDSVEAAQQDLIALELTACDVVIGIAASGRTPYVIGALKYAKQVGCQICSIVCTLNSPIKEICPLTVELLPGAEVLTGSTRLKAGTVTKLVLNMISTLSMVKIGKVYKNYMVDVKISNQKLYARALNIIQRVTGCSEKVAEEKLKEANKSVKLAIAMILTHTDAKQAKDLLQRAEGKIEKIKELC